MTRFTLDSGRQVEHLIQMQREMSRTRPIAETVSEFLRLARAISPADWLVYAMCWPADAESPEACRVLYDGPVGSAVLATPVLSAMFSSDCETFRLVEGGLLPEIMAAGEPRLINDLSLDPEDPGLGHLSEVSRSLLAVPIYWEGRILNWSVSLAPEPDSFDETHLRLYLSNSNMLVRSVKQMKMRERVEELNEQLEHQLRELAGVQRSLLPHRVPEIPGWRIAANYKPSLHAGGDYFDFTHFTDGHVGIVIADVSGHGAAAAALMAVLRTILHTLVSTGVGSIGLIDPVNRIVLDSVGEGTFVSAYFIAVDPSTGEMTCVNCGHPAPRIRRASGEIDIVDGPGLPPLGVLDYDRIPECHGRLGPGDTLVLYTDGITEAFDEDRRMFGTEGIDRAIEEGHGDADATMRAIASRVQAHAPTPDDDQTIVVLERRDDG